MIIEKINSIDIPDQSFEAGGVEISLSEIHIGVKNFSPELIKIDFQSPDIIHITITGIIVEGSFRGHFKWAFISDSESVTMDVKQLYVDMKLKLNTRNVDGKLLPNAIFQEMNLDFDFDFEFHGSLLAKILNLVRDPIRNWIKGKLIETVRDQSQSLLAESFAKLPLYIPILEKGYAADYSLISNPIVESDYWIFNSYGGLVNTNKPETLEHRFPLPTTIPVYDPNGKPVQLYIGSYIINTAFYTFYKTESLAINLTPEMMPKSPFIKLDTTFLSSLFQGLNKVYGDHVPCELNFRVNNNPVIALEDKKINVVLATQVILNVRNATSHENGLSQALIMQTDVKLSADAHVLEGGNITAIIYTLNISNTKITESKVPEAKPEAVESAFQLISGILIPLLNAYLEKVLKIPLPVIHGVKFEDLTLNHYNDYIAINYHFIYQTVITEETDLVSFEQIGDLKLQCRDINRYVKKAKLIVDENNGKAYYKLKCAIKKNISY